MQIINTHQAKTHLSKLIKQAMSGKEVIIGKAGKPVARLVAYKTHKAPRKPGLWKGKVWMSKDFDAEDTLINRIFYGKKL